jgi:hypothetical protein
MFKNKIALAIAALVLASCASQLHRGVVAMKVNDNTAHVGLSKNEVAVGDHVELYGNRCTGSGKNTDRSCEKISKGHGVVTQIINDNYASVQFDSGVAFQEGDFIEKHSH